MDPTHLLKELDLVLLILIYFIEVLDEILM